MTMTSAESKRMCRKLNFNVLLGLSQRVIYSVFNFDVRAQGLRCLHTWLSQPGAKPTNEMGVRPGLITTSPK